MKKKTVRKILFLFSVLSALVLLSSTALAYDGTNPFSKININGKTVGNSVDENEVYNGINSIVTLIYFISGAFVLVALIIASVLLATSANNPQRRSGGFIALGMALVGGWVLYKATDLAGWLSTFGK